MIKRPMLLIFAILVFISGIHNYYFGDKDDAKHYIMDKAFEDSAEVMVEGTAWRYELKTNSCAIYLKDAYVYLDKKYYFSDILIYISEKPYFIIGSKVLFSGVIYKFETPSNPGQFNQKQYYKEKNIYYSVYAKTFEILHEPEGIFNKVKVYLEKFKQALINIYKKALPDRECGIVSMMILGDKSLLDMDIKSLYQENGIGHLLAISGLHVTILCMAVYKLLDALYIPKKISAGTTVAFLFAYGYITGFGISTLRAVIMMTVMLIAQIIHRSYDMLSAAGFSAVIIMLLKSYAIYSCSFLLSFGAIIGIAIIFPALKNIFCSNDYFKVYHSKIGMKSDKNESKYINYIKKFITYKKRLDKRFFNSVSSIFNGKYYFKGIQNIFIYLINAFIFSDGYNSCIYILKLYFSYYNMSFFKKYFIYILCLILKKIKETFLVSLSIQIAILPIILYFYYEFPLYSVFINIIILPLASLLVLLAVLGGLTGIIFLPVGSFILKGVYIILNFYEYICTAALELPYHMVITGRPEIWQIIFYYLLIAIVILTTKYIFYKDILRMIEDNKNKFFTIILKGFVLSVFVVSFAILIYAPKETGLTMAFLDVGQGDCIFIRNNCGTVYLVDGGSSSVDEVGRYRIIPYLKYNGINKIDYVIMTHADSDHISGLLEILEQSGDGIKVKNLLMPNPSTECKDEKYYKMAELAYENGVRTNYIKRGDIIREGDFSMLCLHPETGFNSASANAYSTVLSVKFGNTSYLLTGDIEGEGERELFNILMKNNTNSNLDILNGNTLNSVGIFSEIPKEYNILKVAHHGSKNSTSDDLLEKVSPELSIISCGKNNSYGHPHKELLERLEKSGSKYIATKDAGAVTLYSDGERIKIVKGNNM